VLSLSPSIIGSATFLAADSDDSSYTKPVVTAAVDTLIVGDRVLSATFIKRMCYVVS